jgi:hypothetical protein
MNFEQLFRIPDKIVIDKDHYSIELYADAVPLEHIIPGPYLMFDPYKELPPEPGSEYADYMLWCEERLYGPSPFEPVYFEGDLMSSINLKHLFAHLELKDGKDVSDVLINPLINYFNLGTDFKLLLSSVKLLDPKARTKIMSKVKIRDDDYFSINFISFQHNMDEIINPRFDPEIVDGDLVLNGAYGEQVFSGDDFNLLHSYAYEKLLE